MLHGPAGRSTSAAAVSCICILWCNFLLDGHCPGRIIGNICVIFGCIVSSICLITLYGSWFALLHFATRGTSKAKLEAASRRKHHPTRSEKNHVVVGSAQCCDISFIREYKHMYICLNTYMNACCTSLFTLAWKKYQNLSNLFQALSQNAPKTNGKWFQNGYKI